MLNCHDATRLLSEAQDHSPRMRDRLALKLHLSMCAACRNFGDQLQFLRRASRAYADGSAERANPPGGDGDGGAAESRDTR